MNGDKRGYGPPVAVVAAMVLGVILWQAAEPGPRAPGVPKVTRSLGVGAGAGTNRWYMVATATDSAGWESDYSNEIAASNVVDGAVVRVAWDASASAGTNVIMNYSVYVGRASGTYTNVIRVGTNLAGSVQDGGAVAAAATNRVVTVTALAAASGAGPWLVWTNWPSVRLTNPGTLFLRSSVGVTNY